MKRLATALQLTVVLVGIALFVTGASSAGDDQPAPARADLSVEKIGSFASPTFVTGAPGVDNLLFVTEQGGTVKVLRDGQTAGTFLDISSLVDFNGERGLLSIAFPPDYASSGRFYVYYNDHNGDINVDEFHRGSSPTVADPSTRRNVIRIPHRANTNHNGGQLQFLGNDLFFGTGDGGAGGDPPMNAQNKKVLLGKLIRIDPRNPKGKRSYSIPKSNPFVGRKGRDEIFSYGLRNPFRFSFDTVTASQPRLIIGDVGQNRYEEVDYEKLGGAKGANFGWDAFEGFHRYTEGPGLTKIPKHRTNPIFEYSHDNGCSIIGGYVVGSGGPAALQGRYLYTDFCAGEIRSLKPGLGRASDDASTGLSVSSPSSFGTDNAGHIYVTSVEGGLYRLAG